MQFRRWNIVSSSVVAVALIAAVATPVFCREIRTAQPKQGIGLRDHFDDGCRTSDDHDDARRISGFG